MTGPSAGYDFDPTTPSPLEAVRALRADARDAVVALGSQTGAQRVAYVESGIDSAIRNLATTAPIPHAIFITGSAGGGKSGAAEHQRQADAALFSDIVEDATHSENPSEDQADTLARRLGLLADDARERPQRPILVAANIGMLLQLEAAWRGRDYRFAALMARLFKDLGLPDRELPTIGLPLDIRVLNVDDRPTAGPGGLLRGMLAMVAPKDHGTVFSDARCRTCAAITHCPARANAALLATVASGPVDEIMARAAIDRGRMDTPRALWDYLARITLPDSHYGADGDPCLASQRAYRESDGLWVLTGLLPLTLFAAAGDVGERIAQMDPARAPSLAAYEALASAGLVPEEDAQPLHTLIERAQAQGGYQPALATAAATLGAGIPEAADELLWRGVAARSRLGVGVLTRDLQPQGAAAEGMFLKARDVYERWQSRVGAGEDASDLNDELEEWLGQLVHLLGRGLARLFGETLDDRTFLPVQNYDPRESSRALVQFELDTSTVEPSRDRSTKANPRGTAMVGYVPLAVSLALTAGITLDIDLPTYRLLLAAEAGLAGGSGNAERTFALRRAAEAIARAAAEAPDVPMLVSHPLTGRRYQVTSQVGLGGRVNLRARAVGE